MRTTYLRDTKLKIAIYLHAILIYLADLSYLVQDKFYTNSYYLMYCKLRFGKYNIYTEKNIFKYITIPIKLNYNNM